MIMIIIMVIMRITDYDYYDEWLLCLWLWLWYLNHDLFVACLIHLFFGIHAVISEKCVLHVFFSENDFWNLRYDFQKNIFLRKWLSEFTLWFPKKVFLHRKWLSEFTLWFPKENFLRKWLSEFTLWFPKENSEKMTFGIFAVISVFFLKKKIYFNFAHHRIFFYIINFPF